MSAILAVLSGCGSADHDRDDVTPKPETGHQRLQLAVAEDVATLVDPDGLIANPFDGGSLPPDVYGTALLLRAQERLGLDLITVDPSALTSADVEEYRARSGIPDAWMAFSLQVLGARAELDPVDPSELPDVDDASHDERATQLWLRAVSDPEGDRAEFTAAITSLIDDPDLSAVGLARLLESCEHLQIDCPVREAPIQGAIGIDDVDDMLATSATLDLLGRGVAVEGVDDLDRADLATAADQTIATARGGYELEVATLAAIAFEADGRTSAFEEYLRRSEERRDAATEIYRVYAEPRGTIANTFDAVLAVGPYWPEFLSRDAVVAAVDRDLAERATGDDPAADMRALYLKGLFETADGEERGRIDAAVGACQDSASDIDLRMLLAQLLPLLGETTCRPRVDLTLLDGATEAQRMEALNAAQGGILSNSTEVLAQFAPYLRALPESALHSEVDDPDLLDRLQLLANDRDLLSGKEWDEVADLIGQRVGCRASPHLLRVAAAPDALCDLGLTRLAMSIGVDYSEERDD